MREITKLTGFDGVAPGQKASLKLPLDRRYYSIWVRAVVGTGAGGSTPSTARADVEAAITDIELSSAGQTLRMSSAKELNYINRVNGICNANGSDNAANPHGWAGALALNFANPWQASVQGEDLNSLGTLGMSDLTLDVTLAAGAQNPKLEAWAAFTYANRAPGSIVRMLRKSLNIAQGGEYDLTSLRVGPSYARMHFFSPLVNGAEVFALGRRPFHITKENRALLLKPYDLGIEDDIFTVPFDFTQQLSDAFPTVTAGGKALEDWNIRLDIGGSAGSSAVFPFITEIREPLL